MQPEPADQSPAILDRDIILVVGQNCVGKTKACTILATQLADNGLRCVASVLNDSQFLMRRVMLDDQGGGYGHYHPWCEPERPHQKRGHQHQSQSSVPFMVSSQNVVDSASFDFFSALNNLPRGQQLYIAELTGGENTNNAACPQAALDISFARQAKLLQHGALPREWVQRVLAVVHLTTEPRLRLAASRLEMALHESEVLPGTLSPMKEPVTLDVFGRDDFHCLTPVLHEHGVHRIYDLKNDFTDQFSKQLSEVSDELSVDIQSLITSAQRRDIVLVWGQHNAGIPQIVSQFKYRAGLRGVPFEDTVISDLPIAIDKVREDDTRGGRHHYHSWCDGSTEGHAHGFYDEDRTFTVVGNEIIDAVQAAYFTELSNLPATGKLWFAELSGGENTNPFSEPAFRTDCSFKRLAGLLTGGSLPTNWMRRVLAVVHPVVTDDKVRYEINDIEYFESLEGRGRTVLRGKSSQAVMNIFGKDDFVHMERVFKTKQVPHIYHIRHGDNASFVLRTERLVDDVLDRFKPST